MTMTEKTLANGNIANIDVDFEFPYFVSSGNATYIPIGLSWKSIAIQVSGGLDSAMLLYLTAKTIKENNFDITIRPVSVEIPTKAKSLSSARNVVKKVTELLNFNNMGEMIEAVMPLDQCKQPYKDAFLGQTVNNTLDQNICQFAFNGDTKNPPPEIRGTFKNDDKRQTGRDNRQSIYSGTYVASPHAFMDKKDIVELYVIHGLIDELAPLTLSCDENIETITRRNMPTPCRECWWCSERKYGFTANGFTAEKSFEYVK